MSTNISSQVSDVARKDILELEEKINQFTDGSVAEDKFKHFRLTRGVYGQRQVGVQMVRIKLPIGKLSADQLEAIADASDNYSTGKLHLTTRQDIQLHFVKLEDSPSLWADLETYGITLREACGNTVRNVTASPVAGIDPEEPFDVTQNAMDFAYHFLRNPVCQNMGRKFKVAFSSSSKDSAFGFIHDLGFIPTVRRENGEDSYGFKVLLGGGLGAQAIKATSIYDFIHEQEVIPLTEAVIRIFDRYGERAKRHKARMKYLVRRLGVEKFLQLVEEERKVISGTYPVDHTTMDEIPELPKLDGRQVEKPGTDNYQSWLRTNTFSQKQPSFKGVYIRVQNGDLSSNQARGLAGIVRRFAADDVRITVNQGLLLRYIDTGFVPGVYQALTQIGLAAPGFDSVHDITACPGSDTCNLAVTNSTGLTRALEKILTSEYPELIDEKGVHIKISGCMNSCGHHMNANIGFHGSTIKSGNMVAPAVQVVLGGGLDPDGSGQLADKIIKVPTKRAPQVVRLVLDGYKVDSLKDEAFNEYYRRKGKAYFYQLLKPLADQTRLANSDFFDWEQSAQYKQQIGVGECAGVTLDVIGTVISEATEKLEAAKEGLDSGAFADAIYNTYSSLVIGAKAALLSIDIECNTQAKIISDFDHHLVAAGQFELKGSFENTVYQINKQKPSKDFANDYFNSGKNFLDKLIDFRTRQIGENREQASKIVVDDYYKA